MFKEAIAFTARRTPCDSEHPPPAETDARR
jgi:hypothetical protein